MNDFTKEELEMLWEHSKLLPGEFRPFLDKVRVLIDNYCEHNNAGQDYSCNRCWDCGECW